MTYYNTDTLETLTDSDLEESYDDMLDDLYGELQYWHTSITASAALKNADPIAYRVGFHDWLDGEIESGTIAETVTIGDAWPVTLNA